MSNNVMDSSNNTADIKYSISSIFGMICLKKFYYLKMKKITPRLHILLSFTMYIS